MNHQTTIWVQPITFTFTTERIEIFPKLFIYHGIKKEFQPWYLQILVKLQVDFIHLSERDRFLYIHNKLKNKLLNQVQTWAKTMTEREIFSVQRFFDQLILVYDNFQSMVSRIGLERSRHSGQASFANIYVLGRYTKRATKSKNDSFVR